MATIELITELHEIKELICDVVQHLPYFTTVYIMNNKSYKPWTHADNVTKEFEQLVKLCGKNNILDINIKKFKLKEKIAVYTVIKTICTDDAQATALHTRLTALINMIPVKKTYVKKITPLTLAELNPKQLLTQSLQSKTKIHKISLDNCELRNLQPSDYSLPITNLSEFANIQFYFRKSEAFRIIHLHCVGPVQYLIGNDHKLYVFMRRAHSAGGELVQGSYYDKLQCWTF